MHQTWRRIAALALTSALASAAVATISGCGSSDARDQRAPLQVAAASDLRPVIELLETEFERSHDVDVSFTFGSSGQLKEQILNGAPFDVYASANVEFVDDVVAAGGAEPATRSVFAQGQIVLVAAPGQPLPESLDDLVSGAYRRVAIANPNHAPYGIAAEQAIDRAGLTQALDGRLVVGETVADAFRLVTSGNVDAGIVAVSLAIDADFEYRPVPTKTYEPIRQAAIATGVSDNDATRVAAREFVTFLTSARGRAALTKFGFEVDVVANG